MKRFLLILTIVAISSLASARKRCFELPRCNQELKDNCKGTFDNITCTCKCAQIENCKENFGFDEQSCQCKCNSKLKEQCPENFCEKECKCNESEKGSRFNITKRPPKILKKQRKT